MKPTLYRESLAAVLTQDYPADLMEILVIDGGSTDDTRSIVRTMLYHAKRGRLLDNPKKIQAAALNVGIQAARGEIIARVDGHTIIAPDYVSACVKHLMQRRADNVGGLMRPAGTTYVGRGIALATSSPLWYWRIKISLLGARTICRYRLSGGILAQNI